MINALSPTWIVRALSILVLVLAGGSLAIRAPTAAISLWEYGDAIVSMVSLGVLMLTLRPVFLFLYRHSFADRWCFPLIDGEWSGELRSNWPRVHAMMLASKGERSPFDTLSDELPDGELVTRLEATVTCSLLDIVMEVRIPDSKRFSRTIFVRPQWIRPSAPVITYVYDQVDHGDIAVTDAPRHRGSGVLEYDRSSDQLRGEYWTNRQASKGLNTAGSVIFSRKMAQNRA
jgi:hypothetical protein